MVRFDKSLLNKSLRLAAAFSVLALFINPLAAQMGAPPSPELAKFDRILGSWKGEGSVFMAAGQDAGMPWTGTSRFTKVLNGYFIREDTTIDLGGGQQIAMLAFYGWDERLKNFVQYSTSSMGGTYVAPLDWVSANKFVAMNSMRAMNPMTGKVERAVERWATTFGEGDKSYEILGEKAVDGDAWFHHVTGKFTKSAEDVSAVDANAKAMMPPAEEMQRLEKMRGLYDVKGSMRWGPGEDEAMPIKGTERMDMIFGGQVLSMRTIGEPAGDMPADAQYEGLSYIGWDAVDKSYSLIMVSNMGEMAHLKMYASDNDYVMIHTSVEGGIPMVKRSVLHCDDNGKATKVVTDQMNGSSPAFVSFEATYKIRD